jgi:hypothetical protein
MKPIAKSAAAAALDLSGRLYIEELKAAVKHNPGVAAHRLHELARAAAFTRLVRALETIAGASGTLDSAAPALAPRTRKRSHVS